MPAQSAAAPAGLAWLDARIRSAVQTVAGTDPNPTDPFRGLYVSDDLAKQLLEAPPDTALDAPLARAAERLGLSPLDTAVLGLCAAPELNPRYGRLFAYLHDDVTKKLATARLVAQLLIDGDTSMADVMACFDADAPLRRFGAIRFLEGDGTVPVGERAIKVADRLAAFLLGARVDELRRDGRLRRVPVAPYELGREATVRQLHEVAGPLGESALELPVLVAGPDAAGLLAAALERPLLLADVRDLDNGPLMAQAALECALDGARLVFDGLDDVDMADRGRLQRALTAVRERPLFIANKRDASIALGDRTVLVVECAMPALADRRAAWAALAGTDAVNDVAAKFRLSIGQIREAAGVARLNANGRGDTTPVPADLDLGARQASSSRLGELATRLQPSHTFADLVLPDRPLELLRSISAYLRHRDQVLTEWGYEKAVARTQGLKVLFAGESGTGKTMAAQVLGSELGLELFRVDLATIVSKYIGETEKNLDRIFDAAEGSNAILFFDEADALFGKRSEVSDAHDRYANLEVAYLLQKMERYEGAVILATNYRNNIDDAFLRRLDFVIDFPFPEPEDRERIWGLLLPEEAPLDDDVDVDFLAQQFKLSGGNIRNVSLAAAFLAAEEGEGARIGMKHLVKAIAIEYAKLGRLTLETEFAHFHEVVRGDRAGEAGGQPSAGEAGEAGKPQRPRGPIGPRVQTRIGTKAR